MARKPTPRGERVRSRGHVFYITEHAHAYVVRNNTITYGPTIAQARLALFEWLGRKKWTRIERMPYRHMWTGEIDEEVPCASVVFYFDVGPLCRNQKCRCCKRERVYKP